MDFGTGRIGKKERCPWTSGYVLDMNDRQRLRTKRREQGRSLRCSSTGTNNLHGAARKVVVLNINEKKSQRHMDV